MSRRKKKPYISKWEKDTILIRSIVLKIDQQNIEIGENIKNVFWLKSKIYPETGRMCVLWGRCNARVGDEVMCKGRLNTDGVFLVWSLTITKRAEKNEA